MKRLVWMTAIHCFSFPALADVVKSIEELNAPAPKQAPPSSEPKREVAPAPTPTPKPRAEQAPSASKPRPKSIAKPSSPQPAETDKAELEKNKELKFTSDILTGSKKKGTAELQGNVKIHHGDLYLQSQKAQMIFDDTNKELVRVIATGEVILEKRGTKNAESVYASGGKIEYDRTNNMIFLTQQAYLRQGDDIVRGDLIKYNLTTGIVQAEQVQGNVYPSNQEKEQGSRRGK